MERPTSKFYHLLKILVGLFMVAALLGIRSLLLKSAAQGGSNSADMFTMMSLLIGLDIIFHRPPRLIHYSYGVGIFLIGFGWFFSFVFSQWFVHWVNFYLLPVLLLFCWGLWNDVQAFREYRKKETAGTNMENQ